MSTFIPNLKMMIDIFKPDEEVIDYTDVEGNPQVITRHSHIDATQMKLMPPHIKEMFFREEDDE